MSALVLIKVTLLLLGANNSGHKVHNDGLLDSHGIFKDTFKSISIFFFFFFSMDVNRKNNHRVENALWRVPENDWLQFIRSR